jgi:hypothetical protein
MDIKELTKELCKKHCHHLCHDTKDCVVEDEAREYLHSALTNEGKVSAKDKLLLINENKSNNFDVKSNKELFKQALVEGVNRRIDKTINPPTYDEMLGKIAGMSYESPIDIVVGEVQFKFEQDVMKAIQSYDICVDRDELIKALQYDRHQYEKGFADACKLNTKGEWISVDERLPENELERVLVTLKQGTFTNTIGTNKVDTDIFVEGRWVRWGRYVTHWMPLPEAPKMKGGE